MHLYIGRDPHPCSNTLGASSEFGAKKRWDFYWNPVFPRGGSRTTSWNTSQQPIPSHWVVFVSYQAIPDPLKQRIPFSAKVLQLKKKNNQHAFCMFLLIKVLESHFHSWFPNHRIKKHPINPKISRDRLQIPPNSHLVGGFNPFEKY